MDLYLIRHGETVDNVAGLYAGVRDSALTIHGVNQARRLGEYFVKQNVSFTHIFSSPLSRALKTAEAVCSQQPGAQGGSQQSTGADPRPRIVQVSDLIEQNFGFYEGKPFYARSKPNKSGREAHYEAHRKDAGFVDVESKEMMAKRADAFLDTHLIPLVKGIDGGCRLSVAVVSHGMLLSSLWKRLLLRLPRHSVTIAPEVLAARGNIILEHLGGWANTGYLHLKLESNAPGKSSPIETTPVHQDPPATASASTSAPIPVVGTTKVPIMLDGWSTTIVGIDVKEHLDRLKRQRGGIGRSAFDEGQKKLDGFFKKQRTE